MSTLGQPRDQVWCIDYSSKERLLRQTWEKADTKLQ
jgi:hypothetical protein